MARKDRTAQLFQLLADARAKDDNDQIQIIISDIFKELGIDLSKFKGGAVNSVEKAIR